MIEEKTLTASAVNDTVDLLVVTCSVMVYSLLYYIWAGLGPRIANLPRWLWPNLLSLSN